VASDEVPLAVNAEKTLSDNDGYAMQLFNFNGDFDGLLSDPHYGPAERICPKSPAALQSRFTYVRCAKSVPMYAKSPAALHGVVGRRPCDPQQLRDFFWMSMMASACSSRFWSATILRRSVASSAASGFGASGLGPRLVGVSAEE